jgi:transcriptional regulator with XRE-family HTH domain
LERKESFKNQVLGGILGRFGKKIGVHLQTLSRYERGITEIPADVLIKIADFFEPNLRWLLTGEGEMFVSQSEKCRPDMVREDSTPYGLTEEERQILELLQANPRIAKPVLKLLSSGQGLLKALAELQRIVDPTLGSTKP